MQGTKHSIRQFPPQRSRSCMWRSHLQAFDPMREPPMGAHMLTPRRGYSHHGIYVGRGRIVHYSGLSRGLCRGPVEEVSLSQFSRGRPIWICLEDTNGANPEEVVRRARLRVGENHYRILTNNCEHFCEWCIRGEPRSYQVDALIAGCRGMWQGFVWLLRYVRSLKLFSARAQQLRGAEAALIASPSLAEQVTVRS